MNDFDLLINSKNGDFFKKTYMTYPIIIVSRKSQIPITSITYNT